MSDSCLCVVCRHSDVSGEVVHSGVCRVTTQGADGLGEAGLQGQQGYLTALHFKNKKLRPTEGTLPVRAVQQLLRSIPIL